MEDRNVYELPDLIPDQEMEDEMDSQNTMEQPAAVPIKTGARNRYTIIWNKYGFIIIICGVIVVCAIIIVMWVYFR